MDRMHVAIVIKVILRPNLSVMCPKMGENINGIMKIRLEMIFFSSPQNPNFSLIKSVDISLKHKNPI